MSSQEVKRLKKLDIDMLKEVSRAIEPGSEQESCEASAAKVSCLRASGLSGRGPTVWGHRSSEGPGSWLLNGARIRTKTLIASGTDNGDRSMLCSLLGAANVGSLNSGKASAR
jgi:hypothetical protein